MLRFAGSGHSDVGRVRTDNEDSGFVGPYAALVADGVGGAAAGEVASATAAYAVSAIAVARFPEPPEAVLRAAAEAARSGVQHGIQRDLTRLGMATTLTAVVTDGTRVVLGHVGDSRAYRLRDGGLVRLSADHTYVQDLVDRGRLAPEAVGRHPWRNIVLRSVDGDPDDPGIDLVPLDVRAGDRLLLCTDGLTDLVPDDRVAQLLGLGDPECAVAALVQVALDAGGRDNVTVLVLDVVDGPPVVGEGRLLGAVTNPANVVDRAAAHLS